jgi:NHL repeat
MSNPLNTLRSLRHPHGAGRPARVRVFTGTGASKTGRGTSALSYNTSTCRPAFIVVFLIAACAWLAVHTAPALAASHVFKESFNGGVGHEFSDPSGVAVNNATGDVYVVDKGNNRVQQFTSAGVFVSAFGWGVIGTGASGTGDLAAGSEEITAVTTTSKLFLVGQTITGTGIPAETKITAVGEGTITLSAPATATGTNVALSVAAGAGVVPTNDSQTITVPATVTAGTFTLTFSTPNPSPTEETTANLPFDATASEVQSALQGLSNIGAGNVTVTGSTGGPYTVTFQGTRFADSIVNQLQAESSNLIGGEAVIGTSQTGGGGFEVCTADCQAGIAGSEPGQFEAPEAIAIDNSGETAAEDPSVGDVYVTDHSVVDKFSAEGEYKGQITESETCEKAGEVPPCAESKVVPVPFVTLEGVAVDPQGQLWVYQANKQIDAFSDAQPNVFLSGRESQAFSLTYPSFAVNSEDDLYVANGEEEEVEITKLNGKGEVLGAGLGGFSGKTGVAVEASSNDVYVDSGESGSPAIQEFSPQDKEIGEAFGQKQLGDRGGKALAVSYANVSSGDVYVVDSTEGKVDIFTPPKVTAYAESFSFGSKGTGPGDLSEPLGIAINDATEDVYVVDKGNKRVEEFSKSGALITEFAPPAGEPEAVAVDNSVPADTSAGDVYVTAQLPHGNEPEFANPHAVYKFSSAGMYLGQLRRCPEEEIANGEQCKLIGHPTSGFDFHLTVAVDPEGNVWVGTGNGFGEAFNEFSDTGTYIGSSESPTSLGAAGPGIVAGSSALDPATGELFVDKGNGIDRYASETSPSPLETFPSTGLQESQGITVSPAGTVYATERAAGDVKAFEEFPLPQVAVGVLAGLRPTSVTLQGSVNPEGLAVTECVFEYGETTSYGKTAACEHPNAAEIGTGTSPVEVHADLEGLPSGTTYHYRLVASNHAGTNRSLDHDFTTPGPTITEERVSGVEAKTATLQVTIDPNGFATSYHFEYDTSPYTSSAPHGTDLPVPGALIGSGTSPVSVSVKAQRLESGKTYYYRVVAQSAPLGTPEAFYGPDKTFTTNSGSELTQSCPNEQLRAEQPFGLALPDCRAYEMVSPEETGGQDATDSFIEPSGPNARAAESSANPAITYASKGSFGAPTGAAATDQFVSRREPAEDRWTTQAITPLWNPESTFTYSSFEATAFTPELTAGIAATDAVLPSTGAPESEFLKLYVSNLSSGSYQYVGPGVLPLGTSTDLSHVAFSEDGVVSEWVDGQVVPVSVTNAGAAIQATVGSQTSGSGTSTDERWHAVSSNGSRVYFSSPSEASSGTPVLYLRENAGVGPEQGLSIEEEQSELNGKEECTEPVKACTVQVDAKEEGAPGPSGGGRYWGASAEGERVFFTDENKLTKDSTAAAGDPDLYEYQIEPGHLYGHLTDLTSESTVVNAGEHAAVQGVVQISEDGSYVYFVANGVLTEEPNARGERASQGSCLLAKEKEGSQSPPGATCNLYLSHEGETKFIATLAAGDESDWNPNAFDPTQGGPESNTAVVNPSGSRLAFLSTKELTGYDNHDANTGDPDAEIFLYEADAGGPPVCASCNPTGARPVGPSSFASHPQQASAQYRPRNLLADGTLFFNSSDALVPHASDGRQNVYEYEEGHVYAISNVAGGGESFFLDASPSGEDVFFGSANKLLPQDTGDNVVVWDARQNGGFPFPTAAPPCTTAEACRAASPPTPSVFGTPPSATFSGPGNIAPPAPAVVKKVTKKTAAELKAEKLAKALKQCAKDKQKSKRAKCQKQAKQKYGASKAKKSAHTNRRAK